MPPNKATDICVVMSNPLIIFDNFKDLLIDNLCIKFIRTFLTSLQYVRSHITELSPSCSSRHSLVQEDSRIECELLSDFEYGIGFESLLSHLVEAEF